MKMKDLRRKRKNWCN